MPGWSSLDAVTLIVTNFDTAAEVPEYLSFRYSALERGWSSDPSDPGAWVSINCRPNPFRGTATISFDLDPAGAATRLAVFDLLGRRVKELAMTISARSSTGADQMPRANSTPLRCAATGSPAKTPTILCWASSTVLTINFSPAFRATRSISSRGGQSSSPTAESGG